ncbi:efflux RND transporter periplasmic adaptor subunit [Pelomonas sp. CA6]|uniref:efflux RND transporter periplasmic adaptor subunit n=1 Tax=Pelomonas sp. CA6 TaxID=2907999 RepID=UPI001F4BD49C|nr:efflux RND transporter periplasmic adaptor subunit [Pelomonas sp. CA6]MCH7343186.1 efflux RND transporter periplasmic adaptor subunit [Pelomonas sp. CA6]
MFLFPRKRHAASGAPGVAAGLVSLVLLLAPPAGEAAPAQAAATDWPTVPVQVGGAAAAQAYDGVVEALRQTQVAAQVAGAIVRLDVKAGDAVRAGQVLMRIDPRSADQSAAASAAQVRAAQAGLALARREYERQQQLHQQRFISQAALDQAEAQFKAAQAQAQAQLAQADAAQTQSSFYTVRAPYDGVVSELPVMLGDMALPGKPLLTLYDPRELRVAAAVPQSLDTRGGVRVELPGLAGGDAIVPRALERLPTVDAASHTALLRALLPTPLAGAAPGQFARVWLADAAPAAGAARLSVPAASVLRRGEFSAVYVLGAQGRPLLRQVRVGARQGDRVEVLSGLAAGERVLAQPQMAARAAQ